MMQCRMTAAIAMLAASACTSPVDDVGIRTDAISGADANVDVDGNPDWPIGVDIPGCSGTMISPVHVLTAGHCTGTQDRVFLDARSARGWGPAWRRAYGVVSNTSLNTAPFSGQDLRILVLDHAVPNTTPGTPFFGLTPATWATSVSGSSTHTAVGYGMTGCASESGDGLRRYIDMAGGFFQGAGYQNSNGSVWRVNQDCSPPTVATMDPGDSGGPLLDSSGDIVGVFSGWSARSTPGGVLCGAGCSGSSTGTVEWTDVTTSANRTWIANRLLVDTDGDGTVDFLDPWPGHSVHTDTDGDGVIDALDASPSVSDPFNLGGALMTERWVAEVSVAVL